MSVLWRCLQALGLNAVPAGGFLFGSWSWDTALKLYWFENLMGGLLIGLRIALHAIVGAFMAMVWWGRRPQAFFLAFAGLKAMADEAPQALAALGPGNGRCADLLLGLWDGRIN